MKRTVIAAMVASLLAGSLALADPPEYHHDRGHDQGHDWHQGRDWHHDDHHGDWHRDHHFNAGRYERPHGWHSHHWRRGERLPPAYREEAYVIPNAPVYHLRPPPRGYYWVRVDNNAVLAAVATGVVLDVAVNLFH
ncbi:MAG TPA: RcnB family protein [Steroidobacteraceae bacterium]|nr:RcnB family protein [Steroidobacteraceae bacterium]